MTRRIVLTALAVLGVLAGSAFAAFVSSTSTGVNTFTTRAVASKPVIDGPRITSDPSCGVGRPEDTVQQATELYVCVAQITDPAGVASATADLESVTGETSIPLLTTGGPFGGYAYRSAAIKARSPLETGSSGAWAIRATNVNGDRTTRSGLAYNVRSWTGSIVGEFGAPRETSAAQYYRLNDTGATGANLGSGGTAAVTYNGAPTRRVPGAVVGSPDTAVRLNVSADYLSATRRPSVAGDLSVEVWIRGSAASGQGLGTVWSDSAGIVDAGSATSDADFGVALDATGRVVAGCGNSPAATIRSAAGTLVDGAWHHVVFTRSMASGTIALYVDGGLADSASTCSTVQLTGSTTVWFGRSHESDLAMTGDLDEPVLWGRRLSGSEVLQHFRLVTGT